MEETNTTPEPEVEAGSKSPLEDHMDEQTRAEADELMKTILRTKNAKLLTEAVKHAVIAALNVEGRDHAEELLGEGLKRMGGKPHLFSCKHENHGDEMVALTRYFMDEVVDKARALVPTLIECHKAQQAEQAEALKSNPAAVLALLFGAMAAAVGPLNRRG